MNDEFTEAPPRWNELLTRARRWMGNIGLTRRDWVWGGGTVLMLRHQHRLSWDIDIFLNDHQRLTFLSPRLNEEVEAEVDEYSEQPVHVRCTVRGIGDIDWLSIPSVIDFEPEIMDMPRHGRVQVMSDREILASKIHWRGAQFSGRNLFDFAAVTALRPELRADADLRAIGQGRKNSLLMRLATDGIQNEYAKVRTHDAAPVRLSFNEARNVMLNWLDEPVPSLEIHPAPATMDRSRNIRLPDLTHDYLTRFPGSERLRSDRRGGDRCPDRGFQAG